MKIDDRDTGNRIVYNLVHDEVAQRVVEAYYRQKQSVAHVVEALKRYKTPAVPASKNRNEMIYRQKIAELNHNAAQFTASVLESGVSEEEFYLTFANLYITEVEKLKRKYMQE